MVDKITDPSLLEEFHLEGQWHLPHSDPSTAVGGVLRYTPASGLTLELLDALGAPEMPESGRWAYSGEGSAHAIIHGRTFNGPFEVTLSDCTGGGSPFPKHGGSIQRQVFQVEYAYLGALLDERDLSFDKARVYVTGVRAWLGPSGLSSDILNTFETRELNVHWQQPDPIGFELADGGNGSLEWWGLGPFNEFEAHVAPSPYSEFILPAPLSLPELIRSCATPIRDFSTFVMDSAMAIDSLSVAIPGDARSGTRWIPVVFQLGFHEPEETAKKLPLFRLEDIGETLTAWYGLYESKLRAAIWRLLGRRYLDTYLEDQLATAAAAFEAIAAVSSLDSIAPRSVSDALLAELERVHGETPLDADALEVLRSRLQMSRGPSLQTQIDHVVAKNLTAVKKLVGSSGELAASLARARNKLGHGKMLGIGGLEAHNLVRAAEYVLTAELAARIGIDGDATAKAYERSGRYNYLCRSAAGASWGSDSGDHHPAS